MKNAMTRNIKTKVISATMALIAMAGSTATVLNSSKLSANAEIVTAVNCADIVNNAWLCSIKTTSVGDTEMNDNWSSDIEKKEYELIKKAGMKAIEKGLDVLLKQVPYVNAFAPQIKAQMLQMLGIGVEEEQMTTNELSEQMTKMQEVLNDAIDDQTKTLINAMNNAFTAGSYKESMQELADTVDIAKVMKECKDKYNYTEEEKLVKLAMIVGNYESWTARGTFIKQLRAVASALMGQNYIDNKDMFTALYDTVKQNYQFSGEVYDAISPYILKMMTDYFSYTTLALASLNAQQKLLSDDFNVENIKNKSIMEQYKSLHNDISTIEEMKMSIEKTVFGTQPFIDNGMEVKRNEKTYDSVLQHIESYSDNCNRLIHIPSGKKMDSNFLKVKDRVLIDNNEDETRKYGVNDKEKSTKEDFEKRITGQKSNGGNSNALNKKQMEDLFTHIRKVCNEKKNTGKEYTALDYFANLGFNVNGIGRNDHFITGGGYAEEDYQWSMTDSRWHATIDTINVYSGNKERTCWQYVTHNSGLCRLIAGIRTIWYGESFLMFKTAK